MDEAHGWAPAVGTVTVLTTTEMALGPASLQPFEMLATMTTMTKGTTLAKSDEITVSYVCFSEMNEFEEHWKNATYYLVRRRHLHGVNDDASARPEPD